MRFIKQIRKDQEFQIHMKKHNMRQDIRNSPSPIKSIQYLLREQESGHTTDNYVHSSILGRNNRAP